MSHTVPELFNALIVTIQTLKSHNHALHAKILPTHTPNDGLLASETEKLHKEADDVVTLAKVHLEERSEMFHQIGARYEQPNIVTITDGGGTGATASALPPTPTEPASPAQEPLPVFEAQPIHTIPEPPYKAIGTTP